MLRSESRVAQLHNYLGPVLTALSGWHHRVFISMCLRKMETAGGGSLNSHHHSPRHSYSLSSLTVFTHCLHSLSSLTVFNNMNLTYEDITDILNIHASERLRDKRYDSAIRQDI